MIEYVVVLQFKAPKKFIFFTRYFCPKHQIVMTEQAPKNLEIHVLKHPQIQFQGCQNPL